MFSCEALKLLPLRHGAALEELTRKASWGKTDARLRLTNCGLRALGRVAPAPRVRPSLWVARRPPALSPGGRTEKTVGRPRALPPPVASVVRAARCPNGVCPLRRAAKRPSRGARSAQLK